MQSWHYIYIQQWPRDRTYSKKSTAVTPVTDALTNNWLCYIRTACPRTPFSHSLTCRLRSCQTHALVLFTFAAVLRWRTLALSLGNHAHSSSMPLCSLLLLSTALAWFHAACVITKTMRTQWFPKESMTYLLRSVTTFTFSRKPLTTIRLYATDLTLTSPVPALMRPSSNWWETLSMYVVCSAQPKN